MMPFSVSIIIPAYNEEAIIKKAILQAYTLLDTDGSDFEIIVVNDGSNDNTAQIIDENFFKTEKIRIYHKAQNEGFGSAVRWGIDNAKMQYLLCVPVDSPLTPDVYNAFKHNAAKGDVIVSYRKQRVGYSGWKLFNSWVYHQLISVLFHIHLRDYNWMHMYHRKLFDEGKISIEYNGIFMLAEILIKAKQKNYSFFEIEVEQHERLTGIATASKPSAILKTFVDIFSFRFRQ